VIRLMQREVPWHWSIVPLVAVVLLIVGYQAWHAWQQYEERACFARVDVQLLAGGWGGRCHVDEDGGRRYPL
jgi:hypothetical protein